MAVARIAAGTKVKEIVAETGAHKSLIAKWVREARSTDISSNTMPAFVEVLPPAQQEAPPAVAARADASQPISAFEAKLAESIGRKAAPAGSISVTIPGFTSIDDLALLTRLLARYCIDPAEPAQVKPLI